MEQILQSLNLGTLLGRFQEQRMEPETVLAASDQELVRLGVSTIGDRVRIDDDDDDDKLYLKNHTLASSTFADFHDGRVNYIINSSKNEHIYNSQPNIIP